MAAVGVQTPVSVPSYMRSLPGSVNIPVASFPKGSVNSQPSDPATVAAQITQSLNQHIAALDFAAISQLFVSDGYWRDHLALSWAFRTVQTPSKIADFLQGCSTSRDGFRLKNISIDDSSSVRAPKSVPIDADGNVTGVQFVINVKTALGTGRGLVRLVESGSEWKIHTLYTRLEELAGYEQPMNGRRPKGVEHGGKPGRENWAERRQAEQNFSNGDEPAVVILGAGQAGLTAAARLKMQGVNALVIDKNARVGDNWRKRYHQLVLHDPVWYDHLPYLNFPAHWPVFTPKDKLADFFDAYAKILELNVWTSTELVHTKYDEKTARWTVVVHRTDKGEVRTFHPRHVIQATGHSGMKNQPTVPGYESFAGDRICHSSEFPGAQANSKGKRAVVVGSCNSAHDICQDFLEKGYDVTMVQRSTTHVVSSEAITEIALGAHYAEDGPPVDDGDLLLHGLPTPVLKAYQVKTAQLQHDHDRELLDGLDAAGFKTDRGPDGAGLFFKYFQRGGGYYINVGASQLIAAGKIRVKQGQEIAAVLPDGLRFADGSELRADEIVFATGYQNMRTQTRTFFGDEVADRVGDVWGFNEEGEMRVMWQDSGHPGFWFHGGNLAMCRYYSRLLALQIKGLEEGLYEQGQL